jgi:uncharacterized membrane protein
MCTLHPYATVSCFRRERETEKQERKKHIHVATLVVADVAYASVVVARVAATAGAFDVAAVAIVMMKKKQI